MSTEKLQRLIRLGEVYADDKTIAGFFNDYRWLSNFWPCNVKPVYMMTLSFGNSEAAYQAAKFDDPSVWLHLARSDAAEAKRYARELELEGKVTSQWNKETKLRMMHYALIDKFTRNEDLKLRLIATGTRELIEVNWWGDTFWGVCDGVGQNHLGNTLMAVREEIQLFEI